MIEAEDGGTPCDNSDNEIELDIGFWNKVSLKEEHENSVPVRKIYVSNIHGNTKPADLKEFFSKFGPVTDAYVRSGRRTSKRNQYYAFVTFETAEAAERAMGARRCHLKLRDRVLNVNAANIKHQPDKKREPETSVKGKYRSPVLRSGTLEEFEPEDDGYLKGTRPCKINDLNDDCLGFIFSYFTLNEKIAYEKVCKRWRLTLLDQWSRVTSLDFDKLPDLGTINDDVLGKVLQRCGGSLFRLDLPISHNLSGDALHLIASLCKNLEHLSAHALRVTTSACKLFTLRCKHVKSLVLREPISIRDQDILMMFQRFQLESFCLTQRTIDGVSLVNLPPSLKHLDLTSCNDVNMSHLIIGLSNTPGLRSLKFDYCSSLSKSDFEAVCSKLPLLEELSVVNYFPNLNRNALDRVLLLKHLRKLDFSMNVLVDDRLISSISLECKKLEVLDVSGCCALAGVTDVGIKAIAQNSRVIDLSMGYLSGVTDASLFSLAEAGKLKRLQCIGCPGIGDEGTSRLISLCLELEYLDLSGCSNISKDTSDMAVKTLSLRPDAKRLHLILGGTKVTDSEIPVPNSSLKVSLVDNCVERFKPDFNHDGLFGSEEDEEDYDFDPDEDIDDEYGFDYGFDSDSDGSDYLNNFV
ncbi:F-box/LRR-repeat protein fbxl-1-like isoform X2 [Ischnura elegans]|uniref:F-box/LRR-repeat protein fbxl-1-like isoform X2 n=1 Tax=Ischnura elegans TaxID=197161 RepID=UPI001ED88704|nr:F-box/LRR-repeat protein fbxl-1-like isoform X2 [Ischnura elegans]